MEASPYLNEDVLVEILARLPVKVLLRFRTVCKSWKSMILIGSPEFRSTCCLNNDHHRPADPSWLELLDFPFKSHHIVGSINGLICVSMSRTCVSEVQAVISFMLWNPTIRRHVYLPDLTFTKPGISRPPIEFGYDPTTDDYKIVVLTVPAEFNVYSLNSNAWRRGNLLVHQCPNSKISFCSTGAFVGGKMHWLLCKDLVDYEVGMMRRSFSLYSFDVAQEVFEEVALPPQDPAAARFIIIPQVAVLGDSLLVGQLAYNSHNSWTNIWVQIATGDWKKLYRFEARTWFVCVLKNGELVVDRGGQDGGRYSCLSAYDPRARQFKDLEPLPFSQIRQYWGVVSLNDHQQSLVLLDCTPVGEPSHATCCSMSSCQVQIKRKTPSREKLTSAD
ncbi:F-box family protein [Striga asiatica]|uniref:F-box family protein n=1 Tax=Striga asiatica TaxID=4170 RepID=A0A5A7QTY1_STRAF|nr:F-box family protein [Striga asiatica]